MGRDCLLGDVLTLQRGYDLPSHARRAGPIPIVSSSGVTGTHAEAKVAGPGVVTGRYGTLGQIHYVPGAFWPLNTTLYVRDFKGNDPRFVAYLLQTLNFANRSAAAAVPGINRNDLHRIPVRCPDLQQQRHIASILSAYDDLIENNTRRIAILEEIARRIYEEWFVRFRFPDHEGVRKVESELGLVPEGWSITELGALLSVEKGLSYKGSGLTGDGVPMVNLKNILPGGGFRRDGTKPYSGEYKPRHVVRAGDIVLANTDLTQAGTVVGSPAIVPKLGVGECIFSHHIYAVRLKAALAECRHYVYWLLAHDSFKSFAKGHAVGTTVLGMPKEGVTNFRFARPPEELMRRFSSLASPIHRLAETLHAKNANLLATRDLLLPKLVSGELVVSAVPEPEALAA
ncbi:MAG: restriction endonuclease subunit S [Ramlibacter sp.]